MSNHNRIKVFNEMLREQKEKIILRERKQARSNIRKERSTFVEWFNSITNHNAKAKRLR